MVGPFSKVVLSEMPSNDWSVGSDVGTRRDLRKTHLIFSIDPEGCEDVDDAMSVRYGKGAQIISDHTQQFAGN